MKTLIILAHPSSKSFNKSIAERYKKNVETNWNEAELINLYDEEYKQDFLSFENITEIKEDKVRNLFHKKMTEADEYVFIFPVWWGTIPAILKNFFDNNLSSWFAFKYGKWGKVTKLLEWKTAKIYCTCDAPAFIYKIPFIVWISIKNYLSRAILGFCGIKVVDFNLYSGLRKMTENERKGILDNIK